MKRFFITFCLILLCVLLAVPVSALEITAPEAPQSAEKYMPDDAETFSDGLWYIFKKAIGSLLPDLAEAARVCLALIAIVLLISMVQSFSDNTKSTTDLIGTLAVGSLLMLSTNSLVNLGAETVIELSEYGKVLLPVMTASLAAQGGVTASASLYMGTAIFNAVLTGIIANLIVPLIYVFLCLSIANSALSENMLQKLRNAVKWIASWGMKIILYIFTGYMGITGVVSGTADAAAIKAAKLALSGVVPVVGGIISDASETILVSAGIMKNAAGIYGLLAIVAVAVGPFLQVGVQYLLLKCSAGICTVFGTKSSSELIQDFSTAMGLIMGMIGTVGLLLLISTVCFMKGVS